MADRLNDKPADIAAYPYAVVVNQDDHAPVVVHFATKGAAVLFASLMDEDRLTRWVANVDTHEWHEVTYFH